MKGRQATGREKGDERGRVEIPAPGRGIHHALRGGGPPATSRGCDLALGPPRKLPFSMPMFASICYDMLATR